MPKIAINLSGSGGLIQNSQSTLPYSSAQPNLKYSGTPSQYAQGVVNPMALDGFMSPANDTVTDMGTVNALISSYANSVSPNAQDRIALAEFQEDDTTNSIIHELTSLTDVAVSTALTITGNGTTDYPIVSDITQYLINGNAYFYYAWRSESTGSNSSVGVSSSNFSSPDDDWIDNLPAGDSYIGRDTEVRLIPADNTFMYILSSEHIWKLDGTNTSGGVNGTLTDALAVDNAAGDAIWLDGIDLRGRLWLAMTYFGLRPHGAGAGRRDFTGYIADQKQVGIYIWDRQTTIFTMQDFIPLHGVNELRTIHDFNGVPVVFCIGYDRLTQLRMWNGIDFTIKLILPENAYPRFHQSVYVTSFGMWWIGMNGIIYYFGKLTPQSPANVLYKMGDMTGQVTNGQTLNGTGILAPWGGVDSVTSGYNTTNLAFLVSLSDDGGNYFLKKWYPHAYDPVDTDQKCYTGEVFSKVELIPKLSNMGGVTLHFPAISGGGTTELLDVKIYLNHSSTATKTETLTKDDLVNGFAWISLNKKNVNAVQIGLAWKSENVAKNITPYVAVVDYEPVKKKK